MPGRTQLTPQEREYVLSLAEKLEAQAWDDDYAPIPNQSHVTHALALRLACGESPEEAHSRLLAVRRNT